MKLLMTTSNPISTMEDIIRILREQPEIREAVRREILTEELLDLPRQVAEMATVLRDVLATLERHSEAISELRRDMIEVKADVADLKADVVDLKADVAELKTDVAELKTDVAEVKTDVAGLKTDVAELKGLATMGAAKERYDAIAYEMGLRPRRLLSIGDVFQLAAHEAASEYSPSDLESFKNCDMVIAAESPTEGECYIAVQVSRTVDHGDISRAIAHSQMASRFTGRPAYPVVAGMERAGVTERRLASGSVHWHRIPRSATQPI